MLLCTNYGCYSVLFAILSRVCPENIYSKLKCKQPSMVSSFGHPYEDNNEPSHQFASLGAAEVYRMKDLD